MADQRDVLRWLYFGCIERSGHYLHDLHLRSIRSCDLGYQLTKFDGQLCYAAKDGPYIAALSRLGGLGYSALAFWDYSVDSRPGSNSIFFAPSLFFTPEQLLIDAQVLFPTIFKRFPKAIDISKAIEQERSRVHG